MSNMLKDHPYIWTFTGKRLYPDNLTPDSIDIVDIANGLGRASRFGNQNEVFLSVAQHSMLIAALLPKELRLWALFHDASEAYTGDLTKPFKNSIHDFKELENKLNRVIWDRFGLKGDIPAEVKDIDARVVIDEAQQTFLIVPDWATAYDKDKMDVKIDQLMNSKEARFWWLFTYYFVIGEPKTALEVTNMLRLKQRAAYDH